MDLITALIKESEGYLQLNDIEKLVQEKDDLSNIPTQPLYTVVKSLPTEQVSTLLAKFSPEQRQAMLDIDLWNRDEIDVSEFEFWLKSYATCEELEIRDEFISSEQFLLYFKSRLNIYTFDSEDPQYPESDNYFLTDDGLLLIEYEENFEYVFEIQTYIRGLYSLMGVENAYAHLFKLVVDSICI